MIEAVFAILIGIMVLTLIRQARQHKAKMDHLISALQKYGTHSKDCAIRYVIVNRVEEEDCTKHEVTTNDCTCGFKAFVLGEEDNG